jgi:hypothetical protein
MILEKKIHMRPDEFRISRSARAHYVYICLLFHLSLRKVFTW